MAAADSILRLKVDSQEYDSKLKSATAGLTRYIDGCRKVGGTLEVVEKDTLDYVQALGKMAASSGTTRGKISEMSKAFTELSMQYRQLTEAEKSSPFGTSLKASLDQIAARTRETKAELEGVQSALNNATPSTSGLSGVVSTMGSMSMAIQGVYNGISSLSSSVSEMTEAFAVQEQAELKLETIMKQRMSASDEDIQKIKDLASAQQQLGVIGDEVQLAGAQQVATFLTQRQSLEALLPAMNDLAAQQKGLNVTSEDMVNIGNMFGKVMQGQTAALRRVGITFDESQEKILKYGTEQEKAATLADVITQNVGHMNAVLAKTDSGKAKQMANNFGDMQEEIGKALAKWEPFIKSFSQVGMIAMGIGQVTNAIVGMAKGIVSLTASQTVANLNNRMATSIVNGLSAAFTTNAVAATASSTAIKSVTWAIRGLEIATGIGAAIAIISVAVEVLGSKLTATNAIAENTKKKFEGMTAAEQASAEAAQEATRIRERNNSSMSQVSNAVDGVVSKYKTLQTQWNALKTDAEKTKWIEKNQSSFNSLGMTVNSVNDAYDYFVKNSNKVIAALKAIAEANAYQDLYEEAVKKRAQAGRTKSVATGDFYKVHRTGEKTMWSPQLEEEFQQAGLTTNDYTETTDWLGRHYRTINKSGARKRNAWENRQALARRNARLNPLNSDVDYYGGLMTTAQQNAANLAHDAGISMTGGNSNYSHTPKVNTRTGHGTTTTTNTPDKEETPVNPNSVEGLRQQLSALQKIQAANSTDNETWKAKQKEIDAVQAKIDAITGKEQKQAETPKDLSAFTSKDVSALISNLNTQLAQAPFGSTVYNNLTSQLRDATAFQTLLTDAIKAGLDPAQFEDTWKELFAGQGIDDALTAMVEKINEKRKELGQNPISLDQSTGTVTDVSTSSDGTDTVTKISDSFSKIQEGWQGIEGIGNGIQGITQALQENGNAWETVSGVISGFLQTAGSIMSVVELIDKLTKATQGETAATVAQTVAKKAATTTTVADTAANAANTATTAANSAVATANTAAKSGEAVAGATASGAKLPFPANIAAIAAGVAAVVAALAMISKFSNGGIVPHAAGGYMFGGNRYSGDLQPAMVNSGELILNRAQQGNLASQLDDQQQAFTSSEPYISGENIYFGLTSYLRRSGRGELVFSR